jgi:hypothetical protein
MKYSLLMFVMIIHLPRINAQTNSSKIQFILQDEQKLGSFRQLYKGKDKNALLKVDSLIAEANKALQSGPYSVTFEKAKVAPSGDKHDYVSQAPYWWPDSSKPGGKPYIRRDGRINPERNLSKDYGQLGKLHSDVKQLGLAYYFTGREEYAKKAVQLMQVWFIDTATRMNPNLNFGQYIPGINDGRGIGIIETAGLTNIPDALVMMQGSNNVTPALIASVKQWFRQYADWLVNSKNGKDERSQINNHGTYYDMQLANYSLFVGDTSLARRVIQEQSIPRIDQQFTVDGAQPLELIRTKSWGYATMNLMGWCKLATVAQHLNIDLWNTQTIDGKGIHTVIEWFKPYLLKEKTWKYEQIEPFSYNSILTVLNLAVDKYGAKSFEKVLQLYPEVKQPLGWW